MSRITVARTAGFCFGVDRAVKIVYDELKKHPVATYGPIIHNPSVVKDLENRGVRIINDVSECLPEEYIVIRSHGVGQNIYDEIAAKKRNYVDATCPFVARIHKIVSEKSAEGYTILIAGDPSHPEVAGIVGHSVSDTYVFEDNEALKNIYKKYKNL